MSDDYRQPSAQRERADKSDPQAKDGHDVTGVSITELPLVDIGSLDPPKQKDRSRTRFFQLTLLIMILVPLVVYLIWKYQK